jgi:hypothetical protein
MLIDIREDFGKFNHDQAYDSESDYERNIKQDDDDDDEEEEEETD